MFSESRMSASGSSELNALRKKLNEAMGENFAQYMMFLRQEQIVDKISYHEVFKKQFIWTKRNNLIVEVFSYSRC